MRNLLTDDIPMPSDKKSSGEEKELEKVKDEKYLMYFKKELYLYVIYDE